MAEKESTEQINKLITKNKSLQDALFDSKKSLVKKSNTIQVKLTKLDQIEKINKVLNNRNKRLSSSVNQKLAS